MSTIDNPQTIGDIIRHQGRQRNNEIALEFEGDEMTYGALDLGSNQAANALASVGVGKGDRIAYLGKNSHL